MRIARHMALAFLLLSASAARAGEGVERRAFGLVIGYNGSDDPKVGVLRYADDDAVKNAGLLAQLSSSGSFLLLTRLDPESKALYPHARPSPPTRAAITQAIETLNALMDMARSAGAETVFYLFYSGHGDVENNRGYVHLEDGRFYREDILALLKSIRADNKHLIIDACKSYFLIFDRGAGGSRKPLTGQLIGESDALPADTGVFLSTSSAADSHEWEAFQGGIFSHEIRSALRGGADANSDQAISYEEAAAFVWTANEAIVNQRYRPAFFTRPPRTGKRGEASILADLRSSSSDRLHVGPGIDHHIYLEDAQGCRLADLHPSSSQILALLIPGSRPIFVRNPGDGKEASLPKGSAHLNDIHFHASKVLRRGAEHVAFRSLFAKPFGPGSIRSFHDRPTTEVAWGPRRTDWTWVRRSLGLAAIAFGLTGGSMTGLAAYEQNKVGPLSTGLERSAINNRIDRYNTVAVTFYSLAGAALAGYLIWTLWPKEEVPLHFVSGEDAQLGLGLRF